MSATEDPWEKLRHITLDQLVTSTKLQGSATTITGWTTPEGWPYVLAAVVVKPGNEAVLALFSDFLAKLSHVTPKVREEQRMPHGNGVVNPLAELRAMLKLALVLMGAENDPPTVEEKWLTWVHMTKTKLKELGLE